MQDIKQFTLQELKGIFKEWGQPAFRATQVFSWLYHKGVSDFDLMSDLPAEVREKLKKAFSIRNLGVVKKLVSEDGTEKFLFALPDKNLIEGVVIPAEDRVTGCISSQAGCRFACRFCASGLLGFKRNLTCAEMMEEVLYLKNESGPKRLTHLVFMGTGEPLDNYDNVMKAIRLINSPEGLHIGARRITISTCGIIPGIKRLEREALQIELSVSLHAADDKTRQRLMPVAKIYPLAELMRACREYVLKTNRQITFEYILIAGFNADVQSAQKLSSMLRGLNSKINLIPANPVKELGIVPPNKLEFLLFRDALQKAGIHVTLRKPRGQDIQAACGQLRLLHAR
ncbi:MAG TPA: 23S rRNA (adenine(2503)-C(2))-methyltransferase RlmN [Patescibacteria group bacterium]|nr:23S rRNA (adenine(2503)-C(2))-methyltransferase RlmN [Patescibacteria group bacterium]